MNLFLCVSSLFTFSRCNTQSKQVNIWSKKILGILKGEIGNGKHPLKEIEWGKHCWRSWFFFFFRWRTLFRNCCWLLSFRFIDHQGLEPQNWAIRFQAAQWYEYFVLRGNYFNIFVFSAWFCQCSRGWWSCLLLLSRGCGGAHQLWQSKFNC